MSGTVYIAKDSTCIFRRNVCQHNMHYKNKPIGIKSWALTKTIYLSLCQTDLNLARVNVAI